LKIYFDTSVLVPLFVTDPFSRRARAFLGAKSPVLIVSDFTCAEFSSVISRLVRMKELTVTEAQNAFSNFDIWTAKATTRVEMQPSDVRAVEGMLRRLDLTLRTPDAIGIAISQRIGVDLATFDTKMAACARKLGTAVSAI